MPSRPVKSVLDSGVAGWDSSVDDNLDTILNAPFPLFESPNFGTLDANFPPEQFDNCFAILTDTEVVYKSNGVTWLIWPFTVMPNDAAPTATTLRDALVTAGLMLP